MLRDLAVISKPAEREQAFFSQVGNDLKIKTPGPIIILGAGDRPAPRASDSTSLDPAGVNLASQLTRIPPSRLPLRDGTPSQESRDKAR